MEIAGPRRNSSPLRDRIPQEGEAPAASPLDVAQLTSSEFLGLLAEKNVHLQAHSGHLKVSAPAGVLDDTLRAELRRRKPDLLTAVGASKETSQNPFLRPMDRNRRIPMTPGQQGMWLIDHFEPGNVAYNIPTAFLFEFSFDIEVLQRSVDLLLARHEILRTSFHEEDGELYQSIAREAFSPVGSTDLTSLSEEEAGIECRALFRKQGREPFDLRQAPLVRFHRFHVAPARDVLLLNIHHIIADLQAIATLREELTGCYQTLLAGAAPDLPALSLQYADYAIWESEYLGSRVVEDQIEYWRQKLAGLPPYLELPVSRPYPEQRSAWGGTVSFEVPSAVCESLNRIGRECGATPFMTFLAAYAVLIAQFSGQNDFCIGSPMTQRSRVETQRMIGLFINMIAYRVQLGPGQSFRDILRQVRATALEAYDRSDVPFRTLVRALRFNRRSPRSPIFQVMFGFEPSGAANPAILQIDTDPGTARYDLSLILTEMASGSLFASLEYRADIFDEAKIAALGRQFLDLVQSVANNPDGACPIVPPVEAHTPDLPESNPPPVAPAPSRRGLLGRLPKVFSSRRDR
jgi:hypothetical protein